MKSIYVLFAAICCAMSSSAQQEKGVVKGRLMDKEHNTPCSMVHLVLPQLKRLYSTDSSGRFLLDDLPIKDLTILISQADEVTDSLVIRVVGQEQDLGDIWVKANPGPVNEEPNFILPVLAAETDAAAEEEGTRPEGVSILLHTSKDAFLQAAGFLFTQYGYRPRSYGRSAQQVYINGILMNKLNTGNAQWSAWSGLNDVFRNQSVSYGLMMQEQCVGGLNGSSCFAISASEQTAQHKFVYTLSNRNYHQRLGYTQHSGEGKKGWSYSVSASRRWATEAYVPGTSFDGYSAFLSVSKRWRDRGQLSLSVIGCNSRQAKSGSATEEVYQLYGSQLYNANWGWQNGVKRNAKQAYSFEPLLILSYVANPSGKLSWSSSVMIQSGCSRTSGLDWYNAIDPRPDYYRNLPGFYSSTDAATANKIREYLSGDPAHLQLNWRGLYDANRTNHEVLNNAGGISGNTLSGNRSLYVLSSDVDRVRKYAFALHAMKKVSPSVDWSGGLQVHHQQDNYFRQLDDLLGGTYFVNYNQFAVQAGSSANIRQYDLDHPDRVIRQGDRYRYHYKTSISKGGLWYQAAFNFDRVSFFVGGQVGFTIYLRDGLYRLGVAPESSLGRSSSLLFADYRIKGGCTYKINGRHYLFANGLCAAEEPAIGNVFLSPRTRNQVTDKTTLQRIYSAEAGYIAHAPLYNIRIAGYLTEQQHLCSIQRYYNDEPEYQGFVNFVMQDMAQRYVGLEAGAEYVVDPFFSISAAFSLGQAFYTKSPVVQVFADNDTNAAPGRKAVYIRNYYCGNGPQSVCSGGVIYNGKRHWFLKLYASYFDRNYVSVNPARRSVEAAERIHPDDPLYARIFAQEQMPAFCVMDLSAGKSVRIKRAHQKQPYSVYCSLSVSNLLNKKDIKLAGFEQLRYDFTGNNPDKFPAKYIYAYGRTFLANISFKF